MLQGLRGPRAVTQQLAHRNIRVPARAARVARMAEESEGVIHPTTQRHKEGFGKIEADGNGFHEQKMKVVTVHKEFEKPYITMLVM
jgi:hypothetical protein